MKRRSDVERESPNLTLVATPIGNLGDLSPRAVETLRAADLVLAEDTRVFAKLANAFTIETKVQSFHDHNERQMLPKIMDLMEQGTKVALVSDAGTPGISDPGYRLVTACREKGLSVEAIPGPCAAITALTISGFETDSFYFCGFLPLKPGKRARALTELLAMPTTVVLYESPFKIISTVTAIANQEPEREIFVARELTKLFEEHLRGPSNAVLEQLSKKSPRGEYVLVIRRKPSA